jgi:hypothetical protein
VTVEPIPAFAVVVVVSATVVVGAAVGGVAVVDGATVVTDPLGVVGRDEVTDATTSGDVTTVAPGEPPHATNSKDNARAPTTTKLPVRMLTSLLRIRMRVNRPAG